MYIDDTYILLIIPTAILAIIAQIMVSSSFSKFSKVASRWAISGKDAARIILSASGISDVTIEETPGSLTDHYNPATKTLALSSTVYGKNSLAAIGVAAHEAGHAIQHARGYGPLALRSYLVPAANIGSRIGPYLAIAGLFAGLPMLIDAGIVLFSVAVAFYVITLPVEFNASSRAVQALRSNAILTEDELGGVKRVLSAAAMTYVASALTALASLARLLILRNRRR